MSWLWFCCSVCRLPIQKEKPNVNRNDCCWCGDMSKKEETTNIRTNQPLADSSDSLTVSSLPKKTRVMTLYVYIYIYTATQGLGNLTEPTGASNDSLLRSPVSLGGSGEISGPLGEVLNVRDTLPEPNSSPRPRKQASQIGTLDTPNHPFVGALAVGFREGTVPFFVGAFVLPHIREDHAENGLFNWTPLDVGYHLLEKRVLKAVVPWKSQPATRKQPPSNKSDSYQSSSLHFIRIYKTDTMSACIKHRFS